jgi:hypothetical protein
MKRKYQTQTPPPTPPHVWGGEGDSARRITMSLNGWRRNMKGLFLVCLCIAFLALAQVSAAQQSVSPQLQQQMTSLEAVTSQLRGLNAVTPVDHAFPTRDEVRAYLRHSIDQSLPESDIPRYTAFYSALDLMPADTDLRQVYLTLLGSQVAGFYDPQTKQMNVVSMTGDNPGDSLSILEQVVYVHEYTHTLQDQHFDLAHVLPDSLATSNPDAALARTSLVEGDATDVMTLYMQEVMQRNPLAAFQMLGQDFQAGGMTMPPGTPPILINELEFPYIAGMSFVAALYQSGGWAAVNQAFTDLPNSSEQIIHPEKYLAGDAPQTVTLQPVDAALGIGWTNEWNATLGEFYLGQYLQTQLQAALANQAVAGWGGDQFEVYQNGDQRAWLLKIAWDTPTDAQEFALAYNTFSTDRFPGVNPDASGCRVGSDQPICVRSGAQDTLIVSAPTHDLATALQQSQG